MLANRTKPGVSARIAPAASPTSGPASNVPSRARTRHASTPGTAPASRALHVVTPNVSNESAVSQMTSGGLSKNGFPARKRVPQSPRCTIALASAA